MNAAVTGNAKLFARIKELEADQRRLEWLVSSRDTLTQNEKGEWMLLISGPAKYFGTFREAIDAAIQEDKSDG